jgi:hypothetical protein
MMLMVALLLRKRLNVVRRRALSGPALALLMAWGIPSPALSGDAENPAPAAVGPFELSSADGNSKIRFQFAGQFRITCASRDQGADRDRTESNTMEARRIRLTLSGTIVRPALAYRLHLSAAPGSLELMDFYFDYRLADGVQLRYGQYKVPFTRYRIQSFQRLTFADWSIVTRYFGAERQMGFAVHNGYEKPAAFSYVAGLFSGVNARAAHAIGLPELYGAAITNPSDLAHPGAKSEIHPEVFVHLAHHAKGMDITSESDEERGGLRSSIGLSAAWDLDPAAEQDFTGRLAPELLIKYQGFSAGIIGYAGFSEVDSPTETKLTMLGGLLQGAYRLHRTSEVAVRYAAFDIRDCLIEDVRRRNPLLLSGPAYVKHEFTAGFTIYIVEHAVKWQHDAAWLKRTVAGETRDDFSVRSQFQLAF